MFKHQLLCTVCGGSISFCWGCPDQRGHRPLPIELPSTPTGWRIDQELGDGARYRCSARKLTAILSGRIDEHGKRWLHLSVSHSDRIPTWGELRSVKELFLGDVYAYQVLPPKEFYVNLTPRVLHLWHCLDGPQLPEFSGVLPDGRKSV